MKKVSFEGFNAQYLTFKAAEGAELKKGDFIDFDTEGKVITARAGEICGKCTDINDDLVTVQVSGYMTAQFADNIFFTPGRRHIVLNSQGKIENSSSANSVLVVFTDADSSVLGFIL